jgi:protein gp37
MATTTSIEWTRNDDGSAGRTWNVVTGCDKVSPGCDHCYAENIARRFAGGPGFPNGFAVTVHPERLTAPLRWRKATNVFVNSMSDMFHKDISDDLLAQMFAVMAATPQHTYQILTKRHGRMRSLLANPAFVERFDAEFLDLTVNRFPHLAVEHWGWPLPNVHLGVSCEDQQWADVRIPALLATPAAVRFLSCEPLLGPIDLAGPLVDGCHRPLLTYWLTGRPGYGPEEVGPTGVAMRPLTVGPRIDWVIVGGESGPGARPMHPDWARQLRDQCVTADVPFFFKQFGEWGLDSPLDKDGRIVPGPRGTGITVANDGTVYQPGDLSYPDGPRYGEAVRADHNRANLTAMYRLGKHASGRELDGRTWDEMPRVSEAVAAR